LTAAAACRDVEAARREGDGDWSRGAMSGSAIDVDIDLEAGCAAVVDVDADLEGGSELRSGAMLLKNCRDEADT
jgi:hypothetical protein